nr:WAS/WASL-interacting protein family member 1-like [Tanacetum cinerariifolium]
NARMGAEQTQTVTRQSSTITIAPIQDYVDWRKTASSGSRDLFFMWVSQIHSTLGMLNFDIMSSNIRI